MFIKCKGICPAGADVPDSFANKIVKCPNCNKEFKITGPDYPRTGVWPGWKYYEHFQWKSVPYVAPPSPSLIQEPKHRPTPISQNQGLKQISHRPSLNETGLPERYTLLSVLGTGGFGTVYLAKDRVFDREVAIKALKKEHLTDNSACDRFINEALALTQLNHPNLVTVYDFVGDRFIVMERLEYSLRQLLNQRRKLNLKESANIILSILYALQESHEQDIIHRDIKPENILFSKHGVVKVTDFGVAHLPYGSSDSKYFQKRIPHPGTLIYMSPEQVCGDILDGRSDIYSTGALFFEMLCGDHYLGRPIVMKSQPYDIIQLIINQNPRHLASLFSGLPRQIDDVILKMMHKAKGQRYKNALEAYSEANVSVR